MCSGRKPIRIAFYGKGGIGKSTIASNLSGLMGRQNLKVLHIGCDPKADSTRALAGRKIPTVLEQLDIIERPRREDLIFSGKYGVQCAEAGGPEAGSGCAGLGITTAMDELKRLGVLEEDWDVIVYDVLGDVVCGGFSVPMRQDYVDRVFVVTSSDFMSLYAANNIMKGIRRYGKKKEDLFGGLVLNHVKSGLDMRIGRLFAEKTDADLQACLEESREMRIADFRRELLVQVFPESDNARKLENLAGKIQREELGGNPVPMNAGEMERFGTWIYEREMSE